MNRDDEQYWLKEIQDSVRLAVQAGFDEADQILEDTILEFEDEGTDPEWLESKARTIIQDMFLSHFLNQADWKHTTDCDKLDEAFAELDRHGIIARHNLEQSQTRGHDEMRRIMEHELINKWVVGYVFYCNDDTEGVLINNGLYLAYGSFDQTESENKEVAKIIVDVLKKNGLPSQWNGSPKARIYISMNWQRRRLPFQLVIS